MFFEMRLAFGSSNFLHRLRKKKCAQFEWHLIVELIREREVEESVGDSSTGVRRKTLQSIRSLSIDVNINTFVVVCRSLNPFLSDALAVIQRFG